MHKPDRVVWRDVASVLGGYEEWLRSPGSHPVEVLAVDRVRDPGKVRTTRVDRTDPSGDPTEGGQPCVVGLERLNAGTVDVLDQQYGGLAGGTSGDYTSDRNSGAASKFYPTHLAFLFTGRVRAPARKTTLRSVPEAS